MRTTPLGFALAALLSTVALACAHHDAAPTSSATTLSAATCPCHDGGAGCACGGGMHAGGGCPGCASMAAGDCAGCGSPRGGECCGAMAHGHDTAAGEPSQPRLADTGPMHHGPAVGAATPLTGDQRAALLRALDEEYRAEALYDRIASAIASRPLANVARAEHRHAWVLESLALAHGVDVPENTWGSKPLPSVANAAAACAAGVDSEKKTIALYDALLKKDLPADLRRAFERLRAAAVDRHLPAFEACR